MKKLFLLLTAAVAIVSCSKEKQLARTLDGTWNVKSVTYSASPNVGGFATTINGTGTAVGGTISFDRKALTSNFNVAFSTQPTTVGGIFPVPAIPVTLNGTGTFVNTENSVTITRTDTVQTLTFAILSNNKTTMTWKTSTTTSLDLAGQSVPVPVNLEIGVEKQ